MVAGGPVGSSSATRQGITLPWRCVTVAPMQHVIACGTVPAEGGQFECSKRIPRTSGDGTVAYIQLDHR